MYKLLTVFLSCLIAQLTFGQGRSCDIKGNITSHGDGYSFKSRSTEYVNVSLINLGPDSLRNNDNYSVSYVFGGANIFPKFRKVQRLIIPGDSIVFKDTLDINYDGDIDSFKFCTNVRVYNVGRDSIKIENKNSLENNKHCISAKHTRVTMSAKTKYYKHGLLIYPNPTASDFITVNHPNNSHLGNIYTVNGEFVKSIQLVQGEKTSKITLEEFSQGIYFLSVFHENGITRQKFIVQ